MEDLSLSGSTEELSDTRSSYDLMPHQNLQNEIYYHRELLIHSLEKRRVELLTITSFHGIQENREERLSNLFPDNNSLRCHKFSDKQVRYK